MADVKKPQKQENETTAAQNETPAPLPDFPEIDWLNPSTWPLSLRFAPIAVVLLGIFFSIYYDHFTNDPSNITSPHAQCHATFNHTYYINHARHHVETLTKHGWEFGTAAQAVEELIEPERTVFGEDPFPGGEVPFQGLHLDQAILWVYEKIRSDAKEAHPTLFDDVESGTAPAALGVTAVMVGKRWGDWLAAAERQKQYLLETAPRHKNGAISHLLQGVEVRAEDVYMFPPFLAFYAVQLNDTSLAREAVRQIELYREILRIPSGASKGLWKHTHNADAKTSSDDGAWSTGNGLALYGMLRVRATLSAWSQTRAALASEIASLDKWAAEIVDAGMRVDGSASSGLLPNYLSAPASTPETSGTALFAASVYRLAVLQPAVFAAEKYTSWAARKREAVVAHIDGEAVASPAADLLRYSEATVDEWKGQPSALGQIILLMMSAAWRDCVCKGVCLPAIGENNVYIYV